MDSDDIALPERLAKQVAFLESHPDVGMVATNIKIFPKGGVVTYPPEVRLLDLVTGCRVAHPSVLWVKKAFDMHHLVYNPQFRVTEDYDLWCRAVRHVKIITLPEVLLKYRWHPENIGHTKKESQARQSDAIRRRMLDFLTADKDVQEDLIRLLAPTHKTSIRLLSVLPVMKIKIKRDQKTYRLFGIIPLFKIKRARGRTKYLLFSVLPILSSRKRGDTRRYALFSCLPLCDVKRL